MLTLLLALNGAMPLQSRVRDTVEFALSFRPSGDTAAPVLVRLALPRGRDTATLALPDQWAGRSKLYENLVGLRAVGNGAAITPTESPSRVRFTRPVGSSAEVEWKLRATPPSYSAPDAHNHSDIRNGVAQLVGYDALALPDLGPGTPVRIAIRFDSLPANAAALTSFGSPTGHRPIVARGTLGDISEAAYIFPLAPNALRVHKVSVSGGDLTIALRGRRAIPDSALVDGVRRVVAAERAYWGGRAPRDYLISIGVAPSGTLAGVRLTRTFIADIDSLRPTMDDRVLDLFAHELMHEWIGGAAMHPAPGVRDGELGWFTEGFTEYTSGHAIWRAGLETDSQYVASVNRALSEQALSPARDLPWSQVVETFWRAADAQRQPYLRGELLAMRLAALMRAHAASLDAVLKQLVADASARSGVVTDSVLVRAFGSVLGLDSARAEVTRALSGGVVRLPVNMFEGCATETIDTLTPWDPGFDIDATLRTRVVTGVRPGGAASRAGLRDSMTVRGVDITRGDATRNIVLGVRDASGDRKISWLPAGADPVPVQQWRLESTRRCRP